MNEGAFPGVGVARARVESEAHPGLVQIYPVAALEGVA
jgi:hypothetical protein